MAWTSGLSARRLVLALTVAALMATGAPGSAVATPSTRAAATAVAPTPSGVKIGFNTSARGFSQPVQVTSANDGSGRLFVVEKTGRVKVLIRGVVAPQPYLDLSGMVSSTGEQGLLSIAFHPDFPRVPWVFAAFTYKRNGALLVARYTASGAGGSAVSAATGVTLLAVPHPTYTNHNGGQLMFGPDRLLYIGTGDGGGAGDPFAQAQSLRSLSGKILRIDPSRYCSGLRYCIPSNNPFATSTTSRREIWLTGARNPWRFSIDQVKGWIWIADVGQDGFEEVDVVSTRTTWVNLGWSCYEGRVVYNAARCYRGQPYLAPNLVVPHPTGESITGGFVYRGGLYADLLGGLYVFSDFVTGRVWVYSFGGSAVQQGVNLKGVTSFGESDSGEMYAVTLGGTLFRVTATAA